MDLAHGWGKETKPPEFFANLEKAAFEAIGCDYLQFLKSNIGNLSSVAVLSTRVS